MTNSLFIQLTLMFSFGISILLAQDLVSHDPNDIAFYLFPNPNNSSDFDTLEFLDPSSITDSRYSVSKKLIILTHGFTDSVASLFPTVAIKAYQESGFTESANIIGVDWGKLSGSYVPLPSTALGIIQGLSTLYLEVTDNVPIVGERIEAFITFLQSIEQLSGPSQVHLVGHSMGAHASGFAGKYYQKFTGQNFNRITGLDPAGPVYQERPVEERLAATDADFVDIVHTNQGELGYFGPLGAVDFFVNGGGPERQPGCPPLSLTTLFCSHDLASVYYALSIRNPSLLSHEVSIVGLPDGSGTAVFGEYCPESTRGLYDIKLVVPQGEIPATKVQLELAMATRLFDGPVDIASLLKRRGITIPL